MSCKILVMFLKIEICFKCTLVGSFKNYGFCKNVEYLRLKCGKINNKNTKFTIAFM